MLRRSIGAMLLLASQSALAEFGTAISEPPKVTFEKALPIATEAARLKVPDLDKFLLHSAGPRALKGDKKGMHWQFLWQEAEYKTHMRGVSVRVYMNDGSAVAEKFRE
jgi:hypothetical protein